ESIRFHGFYFIVFLMLGTNLASAAAVDGSAPDSPVQVDGVVKDTSGALVPGAHIRFNSATDAPVEVVADEAGAFQTRLRTGHYLLSAVQTGFEQEEEPLDVSGDIPTHLLLTLKIRGTVESITVTAQTGYGATSATTATRVPMRVLDTPQ